MGLRHGVRGGERSRRVHAEAEAARRLGFIGKSCIHPTQVPLANAVFRPSDAEIAAALRVVDAARGAEADGVGAYWWMAA